MNMARCACWAACEAAAGYEPGYEPVVIALRATKYDENPWRAANLGRSRLFGRPEPAESRLRARLPALQERFSTVPH